MNRPKRTLAALAVGLGAVAVGLAATASATSTRQQSCRTGAPKTIGGVSALVFCGPAKATVRLIGGDYKGARRVTFKNGACASHNRDLYVFIGAIPRKAIASNGLDQPVTSSNYFFLETSYKAGIHQIGNTIFFGYDRQAWKVRALSTQVTVNKGLRSGVFSGALLASEADRVAGSFTC